MYYIDLIYVSCISTLNLNFPTEWCFMSLGNDNTHPQNVHTGKHYIGLVILYRHPFVPISGLKYINTVGKYLLSSTAFRHERCPKCWSLSCKCRHWYHSLIVITCNGYVQKIHNLISYAMDFCIELSVTQFNSTANLLQSNWSLSTSNKRLIDA